MRPFRTFLSFIPIFTLLAFTTIIETGCGGGGGGDTAVPTNLSLVSVGSPGVVGLAAVDTLEVGHPVDVAIEINSTRAIEDVTVSFYIADQAEFDAENVDDTSVQYHIGSAVLPPLQAGLNRVVEQVTLPYMEEDYIPGDEVADPDNPEIFTTTFTEEVTNLAGVLDPSLVYILGRPYYLFVEIDPANLIEETDEEDNIPTELTMDETMVVVSISELNKQTPNIIVENVVVELPAIELTAPEKEVEIDSCGVAIVPERPAVDQDDENSHIGVTAVINATGRYWPDYPNNVPVPIPRIDIQATITPPAALNLAPIELKIWDSAAKAYSNTLSIFDLNPGEPSSVQLDIRMPGYEVLGNNQIADLISAMSSEAASCMTSNCSLDQTLQCFALNSLPLPGSTPICDAAVVNSCQTEFAAYGEYEIMRCVLDRIDPVCLSTCNPDEACLFDCAQEFMGLEVTTTAYNTQGTIIQEYDNPGVVLSNNFEAEIVMLPTPAPPPVAETEPVLFETGFDKGFSAKFAYAGLSAYAFAGLDGEGARAGLEAAIPVVLFRGSPRSCTGGGCISGLDPGDVFLGVTSSLTATPPAYINNNFDLNISSFGVNLFPKSVPVECGITLFNDFSQASVEQCTDLNDAGLLNDAELADCYKNAGGLYKSKDVTKDFVVGVVPLTASFSAWGMIGAELVVEITCSDTGLGLSSHAGPYAGLGTEVSAGVGSSRFLAVGVGGELNPLFNNTFFATVALQDLSVAGGSVSGTLHEDITNTLTGPQGSVFWYLGYPCIKICKAWRIPYPCGLKQCKSKKPFVSFKTFERKDVLFCDNQFFNGPSL